MFAVGRSWFGYSRPTGSVQRIAAHSMFTTLLHTKVAVPFDLFQDLSQALRVEPRSVTFTRTTRVERARARGRDLRSA